MLHTPLHRALGVGPGPITDQMIDDAVAQRIQESEELDWKSQLPNQKGFRENDIVKDIAAFANAGGGLIVFGVTEENKAAIGRMDAGELSEGYERTIQQACMTAITPPVFGVRALTVESNNGTRSAAIMVPDSTDGPHLIWRGEYFGAPLRVSADTHWLREPQIESAYRARFDDARRGEEALQRIHDDMAAAALGVDGSYAVLVGAARPRTRKPRAELRRHVSTIADGASLLARWWMGGDQTGPLEDLAIYSPRPTLSGRYLPPSGPGGRREAHATVFDDGSVGLSWRAGGQLHPGSGKPFADHQVPTIALEAFAAGLLALVHRVAAEASPGDYEIMIGVAQLDEPRQQIEFHVRDAAPPAGVHRPVSGRFRPVRIAADPAVTDTKFIQTAIDIATAALNQIGIEEPAVLSTDLPPRPNWRE